MKTSVGVNAGFGELLNPSQLAIMQQLKFTHCRTEINPTATDVDVRAILNQFVGTSIRPLVLLCGGSRIATVSKLQLASHAVRVWEIAARIDTELVAGFECYNEPDLAGMSSTEAAEHGVAVYRALRGAGFGGWIFALSVSNTHTAGVQYASGMSWETLPADLNAAIHFYAPDADPTRGHRVGRTYADDLELMIRTCAGRIPAVTEVGWHSGPRGRIWGIWPRPRLTNAQITASLVNALHTYMARGVPFVSIYQIADGKADTWINRYGLTTFEGKLKEPQGVELRRLLSVGSPTEPKPTPTPTPTPTPPSTRYTRVSVFAADQPGFAPLTGGTLSFESDDKSKWPDIEAVLEGGRLRFEIPAAAVDGWYVWVKPRTATQTAEMRVKLAPDIDVRMPAEVRARRGVPRFEGHAIVDGDGPWLAVGTSMFWITWGWLHDRARTVENIDCAAGRRPGHKAVDYLRALACVGDHAASGSWQDRAITVNDLLNTGVIAEVTDAVYEKGLRMQWTIFGGFDTATTPALREAVVRRVGDQLSGRAHKLMYVEIANEGWQNGFDGETGRAELFKLAQILRGYLPETLIALTDSRMDGNYSKGSVANLQPVHLERTIDGTGGRLRPVRQAREVVEQGWPWCSQEPIGPDSSVASEHDVERLTLSALYTWLCKGFAYTFHTGAGIRGGGIADLNRGRKANLWEQDAYAPTVAALLAARDALPKDLSNFTWFNSNSRYSGYPFRMEAGGDPKVVAPEDQLLRAFAAIASDGRMVCIPLGVTVPVEFVPKRAMDFERLDVRTSTVQESVALVAGQGKVIPPAQGWVLRGRLR